MTFEKATKQDRETDVPEIRDPEVDAMIHLLFDQLWELSSMSATESLALANTLVLKKGWTQ